MRLIQAFTYVKWTKTTTTNTTLHYYYKVNKNAWHINTITYHRCSNMGFIFNTEPVYVHAG